MSVLLLPVQNEPLTARLEHRRVRRKLERKVETRTRERTRLKPYRIWKLRSCVDLLPIYKRARFYRLGEESSATLRRKQTRRRRRLREMLWLLGKFSPLSSSISPDLSLTRFSIYSKSVATAAAESVRAKFNAMLKGRRGPVQAPDNSTEAARRRDPDATDYHVRSSPSRIFSLYWQLILFANVRLSSGSTITLKRLDGRSPIKTRWYTLSNLLELQSRTKVSSTNRAKNLDPMIYQNFTCSSSRTKSSELVVVLYLAFEDLH